MPPPNVHRFAGQSANNSNYLNDNFDLVLGGNFTHNTAYDSLSGALADFGTDSKTLYVSSEVAITSTATIPSNVSIEVLKGGYFNIASGVTLTITGEFAAGNFQVFKGAGAVVFSGQKKPILNPLWWGALGDGTTDDSLAILSMYNSIRSAGGIVSFPQLTYRISYGFWLPANTMTFLEGSTLKALTTFGQGTIPTHALGAAIFVIGGSITSNGAQSADYANISIIGGGAVLDGNAPNQTGTPPGYNGILIETSPSPIQGNFLRLKNIHVENVTIQYLYHYGLYVEGVENFSAYNVKANYCGANGISVIGGRDITFDTCEASNTRGPNATDSSYGFGFWNEPNNTWQSIENLRYINCYASYNYQGGFLLWNPGQDAGADIRAIGCKTYRNSWDTATQAYRSAVDSPGFITSIPTSYAAKYSIEASDCTAIEEFQSGFKVKRGGGLQTQSLIRYKNCTAFHCLQDDADGYERAAFSVVGTSSPASAARVEIDNPTMIAPPTNTLGYMLAVLYAQDVFVSNPTYKGPATLNAVYGTLPTNRFTSSVQNTAFDPGADEKTGGITGSGTKFFKPIRFASFDQTSEPTEIHLNEMVIWQNDNNEIVGVYINDDTLKRYLVLMASLGAAGQIVKVNASADGWTYAGITITSADIMNGVERINLNGAVDNSGAVVNAIGNISGSGGASINSYGLGVPGDSNTERVLIIHDGSTADLRSLAAGTGTVRTLQLVVGTTVGLSVASSGAVATPNLLTATSGIQIDGGTGAEKRITSNATDGMVVFGRTGSSTDFVLAEGGGANIMDNPAGTISARFYGRILGKKGSDVTSASEITLGDGNYFVITGTTNIDRILTTGWTAGSVVTLEFSASLSVNTEQGNSGSFAEICLDGAAAFSATAGDTLTMAYNGTKWREISRSVLTDV